MSSPLYRKGDEVEIIRRGVIVDVDPRDPARFGIGRPDAFGADAYFRTDDGKVRHTLVTVADTTDPALAEVERLAGELYEAQDALAFVAECCDVADRMGGQITTAHVRRWLEGAKCGRQIAAEREADRG